MLVVLFNQTCYYFLTNSSFCTTLIFNPIQLYFFCHCLNISKKVTFYNIIPAPLTSIYPSVTGSWPMLINFGILFHAFFLNALVKLRKAVIFFYPYDILTLSPVLVLLDISVNCWIRIILKSCFTGRCHQSLQFKSRLPLTLDKDGHNRGV